jgi:3D (Asp-Asp-Asp) domain-containing protein
MIMRPVIIGIVFFQFAVPLAFARYEPIPERGKRAQSLLARVTVYWAKGGSGSDRYTREHKCATGMRLQNGHCAVDPNLIPYGSQVVFPDGTTLAAVDTGTAVRNRKAARRLGRTVYERNAVVIDRFFETKRQALSWAERNPHFITVRVVPPNQRVVTQPSLPPVTRTSTVVTKPNTSSPMSIAGSASISRSPFNKFSR